MIFNTISCSFSQFFYSLLHFIYDCHILRALESLGPRASPLTSSTGTPVKRRTTSLARSSNSKILGDLKKRNSPLLANLLFLIKYTDDYLFDTITVIDSDKSIVSSNFQNVLRVVVDVIELVGFLSPACAAAIKNAETPITPDFVKTVTIRMSTYWFYVLPDDTSILERHIIRFLSFFY